jgi:hypothetical protein
VTKRLDPEVKTLRENVRRGARLLDKYAPGWASKLNDAMKAGQFEMVEPTRCVVGTLELAEWKMSYGGVDYSHFLVSFNGIQLCKWEDTEPYGFFTKSEYEQGDYSDDSYKDAYDLLTELWAEQVAKRMENAAT